MPNHAKNTQPTENLDQSSIPTLIFSSLSSIFLVKMNANNGDTTPKITNITIIKVVGISII